MVFVKHNRAGDRCAAGAQPIQLHTAPLTYAQHTISPCVFSYETRRNQIVLNIELHYILYDVHVNEMARVNWLWWIKWFSVVSWNVSSLSHRIIRARWWMSSADLANYMRQLLCEPKVIWVFGKTESICLGSLELVAAHISKYSQELWSGKISSWNSMRFVMPWKNGRLSKIRAAK